MTAGRIASAPVCVCEELPASEMQKEYVYLKLLCMQRDDKKDC